MVSELNKSLFFYSILFYVVLHHIYLLKCSNTQKAKLEHENYKLSLEHDDYLKLTTELEPLKMLKHDLKSHLSTLELLAQNNKCEDSDVQQYIKRYLYDIDTCPLCNVTGIPILDCILSTHFFAAQNSNITIEKNILWPKDILIDLFDLSTILNNLWSNAITAVSSLHGKDITQYIKFTIKPAHMMLLIYIENPYEGDLKKTSKCNYISRKTTRNHGYGIKNIRKIVERNNGIITFSDDNNIFKVNILFTIKVRNQNEYYYTRRQQKSQRTINWPS